MNNPFLMDSSLTLTSSLNRVPLIGLGELPFDKAMSGKTMHQLIIAPDQSPRDFGRAVGLMLLALVRGDAENRAAFPIWTELHWEWWSGIKRVYLGGGRMSSPEPVLEGMYSLFDDMKQVPCEIIVPKNSGQLPLYGAARYALNSETDNKESYDCHLAFDFGHTNVKRGIAAAGEGEVLEMEILESVPACFTSMDDDAFNKTEGERLHTFISKTIIKTAAQARDKGYNPSPIIGISLANYIQKGRTPIRRGGYGKLLFISENYAEALKSSLSGRLGSSRPILIHDGTAAAYAVGRQDCRCAVITLGTSIGVGFVEE